MAKLAKIQITRAFKACFNGEMHPRDVQPGIYEVVADGAAVGDGQVPQRVADIAEETGRCKPTKKSNGPDAGADKQSASPQTDPALTDQTSNTPDLLDAGSSPSTMPGTSPSEPTEPAAQTSSTPATENGGTTTTASKPSTAKNGPRTAKPA
ncbi:hypothetical protein [Thalassospira xiamenensis]|uniref:Mu-like prophage FluMu N-terminal domain-containing protein n=1 Tax=Thalassospira xiamenensis TaxID=220697 RepID=A0ABR5XWQ1_9PROT|nr:hypothetical protein [Thalassospira xiamenensis]KZC97178.1 hypothetical protein AUP40_04370 [Thalassospira xiamenensis]KZD10229.1 hypothetical protein AUP45_02840 [Thalassospira xiamenensis]MCD1593122.1 hypothetical protein [Thalassospira xiamenensis]